MKLYIVPIRVKIMISLLFVVTAVVSVITFTMANLFHEDKQTYIHDLASMVAVGVAEESRSVMVGYAERLQAYARLISNTTLNQSQKAELLEGFFEDFPTLIAVTLYADGEEFASAHDSVLLDQVGLTPGDLREFDTTNPIPVREIGAGQSFVQNSTITDQLPTLTLAVGQPGVNGREMVIAAVVQLDQLLRLPRRSRVFDISLIDAAGTLLIHSDIGRVVRRETGELQSEMKNTNDTHSAGMTIEYESNGVEMIGGFARVGFGDVTVAAQIPKSAAYLASRNLLRRLLSVALVLLSLAALIALLWSRQLTKPVESLSKATQEIAKGRFDVTVDVKSRDEIGSLAGSFNKMASELHRRESALQETQAQLLQSEKLAAFGQLGAGIAHEVKNPLAGILGCAQLSLMKVEKGTPVHKNLELIQKESRRCKDIIENLMKFARQEKAVLAPIEANEVVEDTVALVNHQLEMQQIKIRKDLASDLPRINGNPNQLQQVLLNLLINAEHAMEGSPGTVTVSTRLIGPEQIEIAIRDTGPGIPETIMNKLFDPFFTTKPTGKGTGLGLSVSFGIIKDHGGEIRPESKPGEGAAFIITLPICKTVDQETSLTPQPVA